MRSKSILFALSFLASNTLLLHGEEDFISNQLVVPHNDTPFSTLKAVASASAASLLTTTEIERFTPVEEDREELNFGRALAIDDERLLVGSPGRSPEDSRPATAPGEVTIFKKGIDGDFSLEQTIPSPINFSKSHFGGAVAIDGEIAVVTAIGSSVGFPQRGEAFVYELVNEEWILAQRLAPSDGSVDLMFGAEVMLLDGEIFVSAVNGRNEFSSSYPGKVYVFSRNGSAWEESQILVPSSSESGDRFGQSLAGENGKLVIGAPSKSIPVPNTQNRDRVGEVYVYEKNGSNWNETEILQNPEPFDGDDFGWDVSISGNTIVVGALDDNREISGVATGAIHVFRQFGGNWSFNQKIDNAGTFDEPRFGRVVELIGDRLLVGNPEAGTDPLAFSGRVLVYDQGTNGLFTESYVVTATTSEEGDIFGIPIVSNGVDIFTGSYGNNTFEGDDSGLVFELLLGQDSGAARELRRAGFVESPFSGGLGSAVALSENYAAALAPSGFGDGKLFVFRRTIANGWQRDGILRTPVSGSFCSGNACLTVDESFMPRILVGASQQNSGDSKGVVYEFQRLLSGEWSLVNTIEPTLLSRSFGRAIDVDGTTLSVGAPSEGDNGVVYLFEQAGTDWNDSATISEQGNSFIGENFGASLSLSAGRLLIGAPLASLGQSNAVGRASLYRQENNDWVFERGFAPRNNLGQLRTGSAVALQNGLAAIADSRGFSLYGFNHFGPLENTWTLTGNYLADEPVGQNPSVVIDGPQIAFGAPAGNRVDLFTHRLDGVTLDATLQRDELEGNAFFGTAIASLSGRILIGTPSESLANDLFGISAGTASLFSVEETGTPQLAVETNEGETIAFNAIRLLDGDLRVGTSLSFGEINYINTGSGNLIVDDLLRTGPRPQSFSLETTATTATVFPIALAPNEGFSIRVIANPIDELSFPRQETVRFISSDLVSPLHLINFRYTAYSDVRDGDGDGLSDWAEFQLSPFGFDFQTAQPEKVALLYENLPALGLRRLEEISVVRANLTIVKGEPGNSDFVLQVTLASEDDGEKMNIAPERLTVAENGSFTYLLEGDAATKAFYLTFGQ